MATVGEVLTLTYYTFDADGDAADATAVSCLITRPDGTSTSPSATKAATGTYTVTFTTAMVGTHGVYWQSTGTNASAKEDSFTVDDNTVAPAVSLSEVKAHLNMTGTDLDRDDELATVIASAQAAVESRVGPLTRRPVTESYNGGTTGIILRQAPAISIASVTENGSPVTDFVLSTGGDVLTATTGYVSRVWTKGHANITVTYTAGRVGVPADLRQAVLELIRHLWSTQRGQQGRSRTGDEFVAGQGYSLPNRVLELIAPYELPGIA